MPTEIFFACLFVLVLRTKVSLYSPGSPGAHSVIRLALNSQRCVCPCILSAGINSKHHHHPAEIPFNILEGVQVRSPGFLTFVSLLGGMHSDCDFFSCTGDLESFVP